MLARVPSIRTAPRAPKLKKLTKDRRRQLVDVVATILKLGEPTRFSFEGFCRHDLRARLCLKGWGWQAADVQADEIVQAALRQIGAVRPTWKQGQPEWTQEGFIPFERTRCVTCGWKLPEGHRLYCSSVCGDFKRYDQHHKWVDAYDYAARREARWSSPIGGSSGRG